MRVSSWWLWTCAAKLHDLGRGTLPLRLSFLVCKMELMIVYSET